ncbi:alpha/beta hydrolase [bacterium]|nr:alpha/beta hydrolase [bacterium]
MFRWAFLVVLTGFLALNPATATAKSDALFVLSGGYNSCNKSQTAVKPYGTGVYLLYDKTVQNWKSRASKISYITTCFYKDAPPSAEMEYVLPDGTEHNGDTGVLQDEIEAFVKKAPDTKVYLIGHSYGAWGGMYLVEHLKPQVKIGGLITIDPIGPSCDSWGVVFGSDDCHRAPTDRDNPAIAKRAPVWMNFYQDADDWLNSSEIPEAENHYIDFGWGPHGDIDSDQRVWDAIEQKLSPTL